jgi:hypothetical protein
MDELLEAVFSLRSVPRLHNENGELLKKEPFLLPKRRPIA